MAQQAARLLSRRLLRRPTGPPDRSADHARRPGLKSSRPKSQHHHARRMVPATLPRPPPTQQLSKARARLPKAKPKTKPRRTRRQSKRKPSPCSRCSTTCPTTAASTRPSRPSCKVCRGSSKTKEAKGPGWTLPKHGFAEQKASLAKKEQAMEDAAKALEEAKQEAEEAQKALEEGRATMVAEQPEEDETVLKLGLADVHNLLHSLQARIHNSSKAERPAKKSRANTGAGAGPAPGQHADQRDPAQSLGQLGRSCASPPPKPPHAARKGGPYAWGRPAPTLQGQPPPTWLPLSLF